ncbi:CBO0543 family protein [Desulfotomaculum defluvii]
MQIAILITIVLLAWKYSDWKNWKQYHCTMLFVALGNLLYHTICASYFLWRIQPHEFSNYTFTGLIYTFIIFPLTTLIFLSNYPTELKPQIFHISKYILIYLVVEWIGLKFHTITYYNRWNLGWSALFLCAMFPIIRVHYKNPLLAYILSAVVVVFIVIYFNIPIDIPIEERKFP